MTRKPRTAREKIDALAEDIATAASQQGVELAEKVEALKALTGYLGAVSKGRRKQDDEAPADGVNFDVFRAAAGQEGEDGSEGRSPSTGLHVGRRQRVRAIRDLGSNEPN